MGTKTNLAHKFYRASQIPDFIRKRKF